jgi:hypothetical protein
LKFKDLHFVPAREEALYACLAAIHDCFDALLSIDIAEACTLPNLFFVRTGYAARALRKLLNICDSQAEFEGRSHIDIKDLKFEYYLDLIIALLGRVHSTSGSTTARAFGLVLLQIRTQARESSKLLSGLPNPKNIDRAETYLDLAANIKNGTECGFVDGCVELERSKEYSESVAVSGKPNPLSGGPSTESPSAQGPADVGNYFNPGPWQVNDPNDAFMGGIDVLQWFEQDFALNSGAFDYDAMSLQPPNGQWR